MDTLSRSSNGKARLEIDTGSAVSASPWEGLKSTFLQSKDNTEQVRIFDLSARTAQLLHRWAARYPLIRRVRVWPLALSVAAATPFSPVEALVSTARLSLWVFTLDDLFDEERVPRARLMRYTDRYCAITHQQIPAPADDSLAAALVEVRDDLKQYPLFKSLGQYWAEALCGTMTAMTQEYQWRLAYRQTGRAALPTYEEYCATGLYSIGGPPHVWAALITTGDASTPRHLDHLREMLTIACTCIRLANDLQSYPKEVSEGKINALVILSQAFQEAGLSSDEALRQATTRVRQDIADGLASLARLRAATLTKTGQSEAAIADIASFVCDFYQQHDYHTFTQQRGRSEGSSSAIATSRS